MNQNSNELFLSSSERQLVQQIKNQTIKLNKNNLSRTKAYLDFHNAHPAIHWAFLGHMVSRNGGWNMTDLRGELLSGFLSEEEKLSFFSFLERGNWLIFQDAYPQFLLYEESVKQNRPLFSLLAYFHVSTFMETIWSHFWRHRNSEILTTGLIINEQSYLEQRVVQNPIYKKAVFHTLEFILQDLLSFSHILFPYEKKGKIQLYGQILRQFDSIHERILLGKRLYKLLYQNQNLLEDTLKWANNNPHTGSRMDYWPQLFHYVKEGIPTNYYVRRIKACQIKAGANRIYSPKLTDVWKNISHSKAEQGDWFKSWKIIEYFFELNEKIDGEIGDEYCKTLEKLEIAAMAKNTLTILE